MSETKITLEKITPEHFLEAMRKVVAKRGESWVYPELTEEALDKGWYLNEQGTCQYSLKDGTPACIIGATLVELGFTPPAFGNTQSAVSVLRDLEIQDMYISWMARTAQTSQDSYMSWGHTLDNVAAEQIAHWQRVVAEEEALEDGDNPEVRMWGVLQ